MIDVRQTLEAKEAEVVAQMEQLSRPVQEQSGISFGKRVGDGTAMAVDRLTAVTAHDNLQGLLDQVRRARSRLDEGSYGTCEVCGRSIDPARLEARPWATRCIEHG